MNHLKAINKEKLGLALVMKEIDATKVRLRPKEKTADGKKARTVKDYKLACVEFEEKMKSKGKEVPKRKGLKEGRGKSGVWNREDWLERYGQLSSMHQDMLQEDHMMVTRSGRRVPARG